MPDGQDFLTALAGGLAGAAPGVGSGIQRAEQARQQAFAAQQTGLAQALELLGRQQKAEATARQTRAKAEKIDISVPNVKNILAGRQSRLKAEVSRLEKSKLDAGGRLPEEQDRLLGFLTAQSRRAERGQEKILSLANQAGKENNATKSIFLDVLGFSPDPASLIGREPLSFDSFEQETLEKARQQGANISFLRQTLRANRSVFVGPREAFGPPPTRTGLAAPGELPPALAPPALGSIEQEVASALVPDFQTRAQAITETTVRGVPTQRGREQLINQETERITSELFSRFSQITGTGPRVRREKRTEREAFREQIRGIISSEVDRARGALPAVQLEPTPAPAGLLPPPETQAGLPAPAGLPPAGPLGLGGVAQALGQAATGALPAPAAPTPPGLDLTTVSRPQIRSLAEGFAGPGASQDDLDTLTDLLDGLIETEDLAGIAGLS